LQGSSEARTPRPETLRVGVGFLGRRSKLGGIGECCELHQRDPNYNTGTVKITMNLSDEVQFLCTFYRLKIHYLC